MDDAEHERRVEALELRVRDLQSQVAALKLALYAAFNSQNRTAYEALDEGRAGLLSQSVEVEHVMHLISLAKDDLVLLGLVPEQQPAEG
ncbi:MAG TPA: hypothetical protein VF699_09240 [Caulobacteraceae bacterium]|jgi:hypothetical protein